MFDDFVQTSLRGPASSSAHHASAGPSASRNAEGIQGVANGFEPIATAQQNLPPVVALEAGFNSISNGSESGNAVFQLGRVQYAFPAPLACLTVSSNVLTMCLYSYPQGATLPQNLPPPPRLVRINLDEPERTEEAEIPLAPTPRNRNALPLDASSVGPYKMFADPTGKHLVISIRNGENFYWASGWKKARPLPKWRGVIVESIAWNPETRQNQRKYTPNASRSTTTGEVLVGSASGDIYEAVLTAAMGSDEEEGDFLDRLARRTAGSAAGTGDIDRTFRHVFSLSERQAVSGLTVVFFSPPNKDPSLSRSRVAIIATTSTRIYEFVGAVGREKKDESDGSGLYSRVFEPYKGSVPNLKSELPGDVPHSELRTWSKADGRAPRALAWLSGPGIYHAVLSFVNQDVGDSVIDSANLLPYPAVVVDDSNPTGGNTVAEVPLGIALTEFHFVLLYSHRVMCISSLDDRVVFDEILPLQPNEKVIGTAVDIARQTYWIYTDASIFELVINDEDRDIWKIYLERGAHESALRHVKTETQRDAVLSAQGDRFFTEGRYIQAAQCFAQSFTRTFEEVVLRLLNVDAQDALRYFLVTRLERLRRTDLTQRTLLATWLVEIYLSKLDQLEDVAAAQAPSEDVENYVLERNMIEDELKQFLITYHDSLDARTTFSLIGRHGRSDIMLHYASVVGEHDRIVRHWIQEEDWSKALDALSRQHDDNLYYKFSSILMKNDPTATVDVWMRRPDLRARRLIPAMLQHKPVKAQPNETVRFLRYAIEEQHDTDAAVHSFLLTTLAKGNDGQDDADVTADLLHFILDGPTNPLTGLPYYDLDFALRVCAENSRHEASVRILAKRGFAENAVELALENDDVELACFCAESVADALPPTGGKIQCDYESLRRQLWLRIAKHVIEAKKDIKSAMELLSLNDNASLLSIEDILPFFPDFTIIDSFKDEICLALESYASRIEDLKGEMESATQTSAHIREDIARLSERFVTVEPDDQCGLCGAEVLLRQFYVFPCRHCVHADCLIAETTRRLPARSLRRLLDLQSQLSKATSGLIPSLPATYAAAVATNGQVATSQDQGTNTSLTRRAGATAAAAVSGVGLDRLPEAIISVLSAGVSVSVAGGKRVLAPLDPFSDPVVRYTPRNTSDGGAAAGHKGLTNGHTDATLDGQFNSNGESVLQSRQAREEAEQVAQLRDEMDCILAAACPLCEGSLTDLGKGFLLTGSDALNDEVLHVAKVNGSKEQTAAMALQQQRRRLQKEEEEWAL